MLIVFCLLADGYCMNTNTHMDTMQFCYSRLAITVVASFPGHVQKLPGNEATMCANLSEL